MNLLDFDRANRIDLCDCVEGMRALPDGCVPLTVTSPPYDGIRTFGGHTMGFEAFRAVARELWRITTPGGVVVWVVQDQIVKGSESGTSCRQQLYFQSLGFRVHHRMVMLGLGHRAVTPVRYGNAIQLALVLSKGRPRTVNLLRDKPNRTAGKLASCVERLADGRVHRQRKVVVGPWGVRGPVWEYPVGGGRSASEPYAFGHPAIMPERMAEDHIRSWSRPGDVVFDPFCGAATTCKMALLNDRRYLGMEVHPPFFDIARRRMRDAHAEYRRRLERSLTGGTPVRPARKFRVIYADPPWPFKPWGTHPDGRNATDHYPTMPVGQIAALPVADVAADDSVLLLWTTGPFLDQAVG